MVKPEVLSQRIERVRAEMRRNKFGVGAIIIPHSEEVSTSDVHYLSGFTGSMGFVVISQNRALLTVDSRYTIQATREAQGAMDVVEWVSWNSLMEIISGGVGKVHRVGLSEKDVTMMFHRVIQEALPSVEFVHIPPIVADIRAIKSEEEIAMIRKALRGTEVALEEAVKYVRPGVSELEVAEVFERALPRGAKLAFDSIVASGPRSIEAHGIASDKIIKEGEVVQFDVGCKIGRYASDISRPIICGTASDEEKRMHEAVAQAIRGSLPFYMPGVETVDAHNSALKILVDLGYEEDKFRHLIGHGIGLDVHEAPGIGPTRKPPQTKFKVGNVGSCEPGIYSESLGYGMRIEVDVVIREDGPETLDDYDRLPWDKLVETGNL